MTTSDKKEPVKGTKTSAIIVGFIVLFVVSLIFDADNGYKTGSSKKNYAEGNLNDSCTMIAIAQMPGFNRWDYDLELRRTHLNGNATVLLRHEKHSGDYIKCLYVKRTNKIEWNTLTRSGRYGLPARYSKESMQVNF